MSLSPSYSMRLPGIRVQNFHIDAGSDIPPGLLLGNPRVLEHLRPARDFRADELVELFPGGRRDFHHQVVQPLLNVGRAARAKRDDVTDGFGREILRPRQPMSTIFAQHLRGDDYDLRVSPGPPDVIAGLVGRRASAQPSRNSRYTTRPPALSPAPGRP